MNACCQSVAFKDRRRLLRRTIRELTSNDIDPIIHYFLQADHNFLKKMGVEPQKLPSYDDWRRRLLEDLERPVPQKQVYYLIWELEGRPVGHSNINKIVFGNEAYIHLHLWKPGERQRGNGMHFITESICRYFEAFELQNLFCEPYAMNPAPNKTLAKVGFEFVKQYNTTPGWINFHQTVNRWALSKEKFISSKLMVPAAYPET
ncbi:MAG: GNAT family protein [Cyanobacteria bacterium P01_G01_bin.38]